MANVKGWDTIGITNIGLLTDGKANLTVTGTDRQIRNIFIPGASIGQTILTLIGIGAKFEEKQNTTLGEAIPSTHLMGINESQIAADATGRDFALVLKTKDGLAMRFHFDRNTIEGLAMALMSVLQKHGIQVQPPSSQGWKN